MGDFLSFICFWKNLKLKYLNKSFNYLTLIFSTKLLWNFYRICMFVFCMMISEIPEKNFVFFFSKFNSDFPIFHLLQSHMNILSYLLSSDCPDSIKISMSEGKLLEWKFNFQFKIVSNSMCYWILQTSICSFAKTFWGFDSMNKDARWLNYEKFSDEQASSWRSNTLRRVVEDF